MIEIARESPDPDQPFANLLPLVDALLAEGNVLLDSGFVLNPDGWRCRLERPLDLQVIAQRFTLPNNIQISAEYDSILDRLTWCSVEGPGTD